MKKKKVIDHIAKLLSQLDELRVQLGAQLAKHEQRLDCIAESIELLAQKAGLTNHAAIRRVEQPIPF